MKNKIKVILVYFLSIIILVNTFYASIAYASESDNGNAEKDEWVIVKDVSDDLKPLNKFIHKGNQLFWYLIAQCGAIVSGDIKTIYDNNEWLEKVDQQCYVVKNTTTGQMGYKFDKVLTDDMLNKIKELNKEPDNGGYELVKTVPASKISSLYFPSPARYTTFKNLLKDNGGIIGLQIYGGYANCYYKVLPDVFWVSGGKYLYKDSNGTHEFYRADGYKNTLSSVVRYNAYDISKADTPAKSWDDAGTSLYMSSASNHEAYRFLLNDSFAYFADSKNVSNPLTQGAYLVTATGAPVPVFNTVSDAVAYSVANNLYYTSSEYTGEGKEIIIPLDEIDKILNGYYNGMYDLLQQLIEQNGGNALTPEQLQKLVDEVKASFGMIQDSINDGFEQQDILIQKNSEIMQNIADALNAFFSQTKDVRNAFMKSFNNYAASQKERDEMLYKLLQDYMAEKEKPPESSETEPSEQETEFLDTVKETNGILQDIYAGLGEFKKSVDDALSDILNALKNIKISPSKPVINDGNGGIWDFLNFATNLAEKLLDGSDEVFDDFMGGITEVGSGLADLFRTRFPFSIPWDIAAFVAALSAPPETPHYEIPITLEQYGIDERIVIDLGDFEIISRISRTFLTVIWSMYLMNLTLKFTDVKNKS